MAHEVLKPFNGFYRRWQAGDTLAVGDDIGPHTIEDLVKRVFLAASPELPEPYLAPDDKPNVAHAAAINGSA